MGGHYLVIIWPNELAEHIKVCPYGDYYDGYETMFNDGDVQVYETFTNPLILRDVTNNNIEVVLDIERNFDLDIEDINQLLVFRIAMVPKTWQDDFGDWISLTAQELSACLNSILDEKAKLDGQVRKKLNKIAEEAAEAAKAASEKPKKSKKPKKKGKGKKKKWPKLSKEEWKKKQALRKDRLDELNKK